MKKEGKNENRQNRFRRIASKRTDLIIHYLHLLGNCSNKSTYSYTDEEIRKIFNAIDDQLRITKSKFKNGRGKKKNRFVL